KCLQIELADTLRRLSAGEPIMTRTHLTIPAALLAALTLAAGPASAQDRGRRSRSGNDSTEQRGSGSGDHAVRRDAERPRREPQAVAPREQRPETVAPREQRPPAVAARP